jgi:hypothetical protein
MKTNETSYQINLDFEAIELPPVTDVLVLGKKTPQGKMGILHSFHLISPDVFQMLEINDEENVEAVIVNRNILSKIPAEEVIKVLKEYVFPYVSKGEAIKVNLSIQISYRGIKGEMNVCENMPSE